MPTGRPSPYAPSRNREVLHAQQFDSANSLYFLQIGFWALSGLVFAVAYTEQFRLSLMLPILQHLTIGIGFWIGWGTISVSSFLTHIILRSSDNTSQWYARLTAVPIGVIVSLIAKYMLDGRL